jgi:hypothetical protein
MSSLTYLRYDLIRPLCRAASAYVARSSPDTPLAIGRNRVAVPAFRCAMRRTHRLVTAGKGGAIEDIAANMVKDVLASVGVLEEGQDSHDCTFSAAALRE